MAVSDDSVLVGNSAYNTKDDFIATDQRIHADGEGTQKSLRIYYDFFHSGRHDEQYRTYMCPWKSIQNFPWTAWRKAISIMCGAIKSFQSATFKYSRKLNIMVTVEYSTKPFHTLHLSIVKNKLADQSKSLIFCSCGWSHKDFQTLRLYCVYISEGSFEIFYYTSNILYILMFR